jgi:predicted ribosomally synthesized peptide with SipW-like signal peptide
MKAAECFRVRPSVVLAGALIAAATMAYWHSSRDDSIGTGLFAAQPGLTLNAEPGPLPDLAFEDGEGNSMKLSDFRSRVVLLNVWATWCAPCREEMPTLDRLQAILGGPGFEVVTLAVDQRGLESVKRFLSGIGIKNLRIYLDRNSASMVDSSVLGIPISTSKSSLGVFGLPTTLLIDRQGRELARLVGPAKWDSPEMITLIQRQLQRDQQAPAE